MKILHIVPTYYPAVRYGGPILAIHSLCKALVELGHDVTVITTNVDSDKDMDVPLGQPVLIDGVKVFYYPSHFLRRWFFSWSMKKKIQEIVSQVDFVHLHSLFLWPTFVAARAAARAGIPYCVAPRGALVNELISRKSRLKKKAAFFLFEEKNLSQASFIHATSFLEKENIVATDIAYRAVEVIENGIEIDAQQSERFLIKKSFTTKGYSHYLLFLGRISWKKQIDKIICALPYIDQKIQLVIAGYDDEDLILALKKMAEYLRQSERVHFLGAVHGYHKEELLSQSIALVLPSIHENFGNVILESWAQKRPVMLSQNIGLTKTMLEYKAGVLIPENPQAFGDLVNQLCADSNLLDEMGKNGFDLVMQEYAWKKRAQELVEVYRQYREA